MPRPKKQISFSSFGSDVKEARKAMGLSRRELAELLNIDPRYLANLENSGYLPSLQIFHVIVTVCKLPVEKYFHLETDEEFESAERQRITIKLRQCPDKYLPFVESAIDTANKQEEAGDE